MNRMMCIIAAGVAFSAAFVAKAVDRTISEDYTLTADEVVDGTLTIASGVNVNLNGHSLMVSGLAGSGGIMTSVLPSGYVELEYVAATGAQYIDTGYTPTAAVKVETDIAYTGTTGSGIYRAIVAASDSNANGHFGLWVWPTSGSKWTVTYGGNSSCYANTAVTVGTKYKIVAAWASGAQSVSANGTSRSTTLASTTSISHTMYLPARNRNGTATELSSCKIYGLKLYKPQSTLVRNYVPAKRSSDDAIGLYDLVSDTFFPSESSTAFVAGPEIGVTGGELQLNVASGVAMTNSTVAISNTVKVVKLGAGTYCADKKNYYTGGTVVNEGIITGTTSLDGSYGFGAWGSSVEIKDGAQALINGVNSVLNGYEVTIEGSGPDGTGAIYGNLDAGYYKTPFIQGLSLSSNATINVVAEDAFNINNNSKTAYVALNGHELTLAGTGRIILWSASVTNEGSIVASIDPGSSATNICVYTMGNGFSAPLVDFTVPSGKAVGGEQAYVVSNMTFGGVWSGKSGASLTVLGYYKPTSTATSYPRTTLGDATHLNPALDLGEISSALDGVTFVANSAVTIDAGSRTLTVGEQLVSWTDGNAPDSSVSFTLCTNGVAVADRTLTIKDDGDERGLYVKNSTEPAYAQFVDGEWKYFAEDGTEYEGEWTGGVTDMMDVRFSTVAEYEAVCATNFSPLAFVMATNNFVNTSGATCDLTSLATFSFTAGTVLDANGGCIKVPTTMAGGATAFTVTNSSDQVGSLELKVSSGDIVSNTVMKIAG